MQNSDIPHNSATVDTVPPDIIRDADSVPHHAFCPRQESLEINFSCCVI